MPLTEDVDLLVEGCVENLSLLLSVLAGYGEGFASELAVENFDDGEGATRIVEETEQCQIDIFTRMSGRERGGVSALHGARFHRPPVVGQP